MANTNYESTLRYIYENESSLTEIMKGLSVAGISTKLTTARFVIDLFNNSRQLQGTTKEQFFSQMIGEELLELLVGMLTLNERTVSLPAKAEATKGIKEIVKEVVEHIVEVVSNEEEKLMEMEDREEVDMEYDVKKLDLLKVHAAVILTNCFQILPSKVILHISFTRDCKGYSSVGSPKTRRLCNAHTGDFTSPLLLLRWNEARNLRIL